MGFLEDMQKASMFFTGGAGAPAQGAAAADMRRKIALAMLMKKNPYPKTFGEGLSAIGDALGDRGMAARLELEASQQAAKTDAEIAADAARGSGASTTTGPRAEAVVPLADQVAEAADSPAPAATMANPLPAQTAIATPPPGGVHPNVASWHGFATRPREQGGLGVQPHHAAGIVGNLQAESGPTIRPAGVVGDNGTAFGAAQWRNDRYRNLQNFARASGMDPMTTEAQQAFMRHELTGSGAHGGGSEARAYQALLAAKDPSSAAAAFDRNYERSSGQHLARRQAAAVNLARVMNDPNATPRDRVAAVEAARTADTPPTPSDTAQEARISDVVGMTRAPPSFGATAALGGRAGDVQSDMPPVTGGLQGPLGASVGDTVQQRQDTLGPQPAPPPVPPAGAGATAQAAPSVFPPVVNDGGPPKAILPGGGLPPPIAPQVSQAPPDPRAAIRTAPPPEEYKPRNRPQPEPPAAPGMGPIEQQLTREVLNRDVDERRKEAARGIIAAERAQRAIPFNNAMKKYEADIADWKEEQKQERGYRMTLPKQAADIDQSRASTGKTQLESDKLALELGGYPAQLVQERLKREAEVGSAQAKAEMEKDDARIKRRTGQLPSELYPKLDKEKASVDQTIKAQSAQQLARRAIRDGVITGYGANGIVAGAKFAEWAFKNGMSGNLAANTEIMSSTLKAGLSEAIKTVNGEGGTGVSNTDVRIAEGIQGSDPGLQLKTIKTIMDRAAEINHRKIDSYEAKIDRYLSGEPAEDFYKIGGGLIPEAKVKVLLENPTDQTKAQFDEVYGPGAANLQIKRFERAQSRSGQ